MPRWKELHFFSRRNWTERLEWYESRFSPAIARGEASTSYSMYPFRPRVPERIHSLVPDMKLVYLVRDPVERLMAHYIEWISLGFERRPLLDALGALDEANPYICSSMYAAQLDEYLRFFPSDRILVLDQQQLLDRRQATLQGVFTFLGVDPSYVSPEFSRHLNSRGEKIALNRLGRWMVRNRKIRRRILRPLVRSGGSWRPLRRLIGPPASTPVLDASTRRRLVALFSEDADRLRRRTGEEFADWSV